jgi:hypothetical protein
VVSPGVGAGPESGHRPGPGYLDHDRDLDGLARLCLALAGELWACRDRMAVLEACLGQAGLLAEGAVDAYQPDPELQSRLLTERRRLMERVMTAAAGVPFPSAGPGAPNPDPAP